MRYVLASTVRALSFAGAVIAFLIAVFFAITMLSLPVHARDSGQWGDKPAEVRRWFQQLMRPDRPQASCCGEADAYEADSYEVEGDHYVAIITDGKGRFQPGTRIPVPNEKMKWDNGNPTGHGIIFIGISNDEVYCYVAPGGV